MATGFMYTSVCLIAVHIRVRGFFSSLKYLTSLRFQCGCQKEWSGPVLGEGRDAAFAVQLAEFLIELDAVQSHSDARDPLEKISGGAVGCGGYTGRRRDRVELTM